jgi:multisubunit Na+/H+ antiporter MnhG subunit
VSGPLVKSVTANLSANTIACFESNLAKRLILAVISIPIWMIIVLLSPIDAYLLARTAVRQEN